MKKRLLATLLSLVMVLTMLPVSAFAATGDALPALEVTATPKTSDDYSTVTLSAKDSDGNAVESNLYYTTSATEIEAVKDGDPLTGYQAYNNAVTVENGHLYVAMAVSEDSGSTATAWGTAPIQKPTAIEFTAVNTDGETALTFGDDGNGSLPTGAKLSVLDAAPTTPAVEDSTRATRATEAAAWTITDTAAQDIKDATVGKYIAIAVVSSDSKITNWGVAEVTEAEVSYTALTVTEGTDDNAGKLMVAVASGTVPTGLQYVVLDADPQWDENTTANDVTTAVTGKNPQACTPGTTTVPPKTESAQYVVVYKVGEEKLEAYGVLEIEAEVSGYTALTVTEGTGDNAGKLMVAATGGTVPTGLQYVVLDADPQWDENTTANDVTTAVTGKNPQACTSGTTTVPPKTESAQYVVVYKVGEEKLEAYGVLEIEAVVSGYTALTVTEGADDNAGKLMVAAAGGTVPTGLQYVVLDVDPQWSANTTTAQVTAALEGKTPLDYTSGTTTVPAKTAADQYVVVYKVGAEKLEAYGVLKVAALVVDNDITVKANGQGDSLIDFKEATKEYTVMIDDGVDSIVITATGDATITDADNEPVRDGTVAIDAGKVSTVKVTFDEDVYTIKLVWPSKPVEDIKEDDTKVNTSSDVDVDATGTTATLTLTDDVVDEVLVAINNAKVVNDAAKPDEEAKPVIIQATVDDADKGATTEVTLPVAVSDALEKTQVAAEIQTNAGTVTLSSEAIVQAQGTTAAAALTVVIEKKAVDTTVEGQKEVARFAVSVKKAGQTTDATIDKLSNPIKLVFRVLKNAIDGKVTDPRLAYFNNGKYEALSKSEKPELVNNGNEYEFRAETTHLSEFAVVALAEIEGEQPLDELEISIDGSATDTIKFDASHTALVPLSATQNSFTFTVPADTKVEATDGVTAEIDGSGLVTVKATANGKVTFTLNGTVYTINVTKDASTGSNRIEWKSIGYGTFPNQFKQVTIKNTTAGKVYLVEVTDNTHAPGLHNFLVVDGNGGDVSFYLLYAATYVKVWEVDAADILNAAGDEILDQKSSPLEKALS